MRSDHHYPEEGPARRVRVDGFWMDESPVTNEQFASFVEATGWVTLAETAPNPSDYPGILPEMIQAGSLCFDSPSGPVSLNDFTQWWSFRFGACWRAPEGPGSTLEGREDHPVVHVTHADAQAYAAWAGKVLPTEAEWEFAARGGLDGAAYAWGDELAPAGKMLANYWQGMFPWENLATDGFEGTSPARSFPANGYGLFDMIGNVWEWTDDWYSDAPAGKKRGDCCIPANPRGALERESVDPCQPISRSVARFSRAAHTFAQRTTASATALPHATRNRSTLRPAMSASDS